MCGSAGNLRGEHPQTFSSYSPEPGFAILAHALIQWKLPVFSKNLRVMETSCWLNLPFQWARQGGEAAVACFHSVTNMINGLNWSVLVPLHHLHQVLKSLNWGRKHQHWLKEEEECVWHGLEGVVAMFHHLHPDLNQDPYWRNQSDF